jgi:putative endonuclease
MRLGHRGEQVVAEWYEGNGYAVVARNWRCAQGEIDLLCTRAETEWCTTLVVCEVKARSSAAFGHGLEAVTPTKQRRLRRLATAYLRSQDLHYDHIRFDVAAVTGHALQVVESAF